jgi:hypothetical protein
MKKVGKKFMKECPFAKKQCGDWCQLFTGKQCVLQSLDTWLCGMALDIQAMKAKGD